MILGAGSCASAGGRKSAAAPASPEQVALSQARQEFFRGRQAALSGDFQCAEDAFGRALESVRPAGGPAPADPATVDFSVVLYEWITGFKLFTGESAPVLGARKRK